MIIRFIRLISGIVTLINTLIILTFFYQKIFVGKTILSHFNLTPGSADGEALWTLIFLTAGTPLIGFSFFYFHHEICKFEIEQARQMQKSLEKS